jgi:hypothetical protein
MVFHQEMNSKSMGIVGSHDGRDVDAECFDQVGKLFLSGFSLLIAPLALRELSNIHSIEP